MKESSEDLSVAPLISLDDLTANFESRMSVEVAH